MRLNLSIGQRTALGFLLMILLVLIVIGPWLLRQLMEYSQNLIMNIPMLIG